MQSSNLCPLFSIHSSNLHVPFIATPSSSPVIIKDIEPLNSFEHSSKYLLTAEIKELIDPFISAAPLPIIILPSFLPSNGGLVHESSSTTGTTSVCPANDKHGLFLPI